MWGSCVVGCAAGLGPQPVLFLSYMDGLPGGVRPQVCLLADDTVMCLSVNSPGDLAALRRDLDQLSSAECLGVSISTNLNFNNHINRITSSANKSLGFIKQNIRHKHHSVCEASYKTIVRPQLEYGSTVWSPYTQSYSYKIEINGAAQSCPLDSE